MIHRLKLIQNIPGELIIQADLNLQKLQKKWVFLDIFIIQLALYTDLIKKWFLKIPQKNQ